MITPDQIEALEQRARRAQQYGIAALKPDDLLALLADRKELMAENERLRENVKDLAERKRVTGHYRGIFKERAEHAESRVRLLTEALAPFGRAVDVAEMRSGPLNDNTPLTRAHEEQMRGYPLADHFMAARAALKEPT